MSALHESTRKGTVFGKFNGNRSLRNDDRDILIKLHFSE